MNPSVMPRRKFVGLLLALSLATLTLPAVAASRQVEVWKDPTCECCKDWIAILRSAGFIVTTHDNGNATARQKAGVTRQYGSCHTAIVDGYVIEGHVPVREIERLLTERPNAIGLAVPGMVIGSPGMEQGSRVDPYTVLLLLRDGGSSAYAKYR